MEHLPEQEELRRRLKAARALRDLTLKQLAEQIPAEAKLGERTLRKLDSGESILTPPILRELAASMSLPYAWFTVPDLAAAVGGETFEERLTLMERAMSELWATVRPAPARAGSVRHTSGG